MSRNLVVTKNRLSRFFPLRTKDERKELDWDSILGIVIGEVYRKELAVPDLSAFEALSAAEFKQRIDDASFWSTLKTMYFDTKDILQIAPEFLLFRSNEAEDNKHNQRIGEMFVQLMGGQTLLNFTPMRLNFIEQVLFEVLEKNGLKAKIIKKHGKVAEQSFLPFMTQCFKQDLAFLGTKPRYLLDNFQSFLRLYGFLYTSQLAHNLINWSQGEPKPCENYLILDTEKASAERHYLKDAGYKQLYKHVHRIFPYLTMSEMLQADHEEIVPLWQLADGIRDCDSVTSHLNEFSHSFKAERNLTKAELVDKPEPIGALSQVLKLSSEQFKTGNKDKDDINSNFAKATLKHLCADFIQQRGAAGSVLVMNQDYLLLLTNLVIGPKESLRLNELIKGFNQRGVFFDKHSQAEIVQFYERIGNVERMSDSGDAVYVRKTV
ncbi:DNA phosphorothioation-dependent restriction protein DptG [Idiomarina sp. A28L]|uniref:DNA phosphorothioation-dependent restriction protein DptG n=1 Tax=Idiomarina sp. A28L TaxID=1036674 RepID=UPI0011120DAE|nr:DNA phosphorothioation-dependent restriction protein DptG [Idiomarina sp. A28L]